MPYKPHSTLNKKHIRKQFRKQQRKLKKKSKKLAKQFTKLHKETKLKTNIKTNNRRNRGKKNNDNKKRVRFADNAKNDKDKIKNDREDSWIDHREEKWIKSLERRLGFSRNQDTEYWKGQEFTQDGLDCFHNLEYLSDEDDHEMDQEGENQYKEYMEFKAYLKLNKNATFDDFKKFKQSKKDREIKQEMNDFLESDQDDNNDIDIDIDIDIDKKSSALTQKYVPPHLRKMQLILNNDKNKTNQLKRNFGAHLNRLMANNLIIITNLFQTYFEDEQYDNKEITNTFCQCIYTIINKEQETLALNSIILCLSGLCSSIYFINGIFVGTNIIQIFTEYFHDNDNKKNKTSFLHNLLRLLSYLYLFEMIDAKYLINLMIDFVQDKNKCNIYNFDLIKIPMTICGVDLRRDDPLTFKTLIVLICNISKELLNENENVKFEIDIEDTIKIVYDIKDNKLSSNKEKQTLSFRKLKSSLSTIKLQSKLKQIKKIKDIKLSKIANGSNKNESENEKFSEKLLSLSKKFKMKTQIERTIFCAIIDSNDYIEAFEKLLKLNVINNHYMDIVNIILILCLRQTKYNKFYCLLFGKLIKHNKGLKFSLHCGIWDKLSEIDIMPTNDIINLGKLLAHLISLHFVNLIIFKKINILQTTAKHLLFINTFFIHLVSSTNSNNIESIFKALSYNQKLIKLKQDIDLLFNTILIPKTKENIKRLKQKGINNKLEIRKQENLLIILRHILNLTQDYQLLKTSIYNKTIL